MSTRIHILCIGSELLNGRTLNTNLHFLGRVLHEVGCEVVRESCVDDDPEAIRSVLAQAAAAEEHVIAIGGLGPTDDDLTREVVAAYLGVELVHDEEHHARITEIYSRRGREPGATGLKMAAVPAGADTIPNPNGTAQGIWCYAETGDVILLPGPPNELQPMVMQHVLPRLAPENGFGRAMVCCTIYGTAESEIQKRISASVDTRDVTIAYRLDFGRCEVRFSGRHDQLNELIWVRDAVVVEFGVDAVVNDVPLPLHVVDLVRRRGGTLAAAESCTGGMIAAAITDFAGVSDVFLGSAVTYANKWKTALLGVTEETLAAHGAVSPETAAAMVSGVSERYGATCAMAVSGIAGPGGDVPGKPVGHVEFAIIVDGVVQTETRQFHGDRAIVRSRAAATAFNLLRRQLASSTTIA